MKSAFRNLLISVWLITLCVFLGWSYARHKGLSNPIKTPLSHPITKGLSQGLYVAYPPAEFNSNPRGLLSFLEFSAALSPRLVLWLDVRPLFDGRLVLARDEVDLNSAIRFDEALSRFPRHRLIVNVRGNRPSLLTETKAAIEKAGASDRILIQSPEEVFLKELRQERPLWLFGTSLAQNAQMIMLTTVGLESLSPIRGDVIVIDDLRALKRLNASAVTEARRRNLRIVAGPVQSKEEAQELRARGVDGVLITKPETILDLISERAER